MNKIFSKITIIVLIIVTASCSYKPIFSEQSYNFQIENISYTGDQEINRIIKRKLSLIEESESNVRKKFDIIIESEKNKNIISNDSKGDPLKFEITVFVLYRILENGNMILKREIEKSNVYNNKIDKFELEQNEKTIIENLSDKISENLISSIINLNDN